LKSSPRTKQRGGDLFWHTSESNTFIWKEAELSLRCRPNRIKPKITHLVDDAPRGMREDAMSKSRTELLPRCAMHPGFA
jgi:hypothetical protein